MQILGAPGQSGIGLTFAGAAAPVGLNWVRSNRLDAIAGIALENQPLGFGLTTRNANWIER